MLRYVDKNNNVICKGCYVSICGEEPKMVYETTDQFGNADLGINASNENYLKLHPDSIREYYSLSNFSSDDIEIVKVN